MVTNAKVWRDKARQLRTEGVEVVLPSGNVARVRNVPMTQLLVHIKNRNELDTLTPILAEQLGNNKPTLQLKDKDIVAQSELYYAFVDTIVQLAMVYPRVVAKPESDDEIGLDDIDQEDKNTLVELLEMPARQLEPFRRRLAANLELVPDSENVANKTE